MKWKNVVGVKLKSIVEATSARSVQDIFNVAITSGMYSTYNYQYMCLALSVLYKKGEITYYEYRKGRRAIIEYLGRYSRLEDALEAAGYHNYFEYRLSIFKNWKDRPKLR